VLIGPRWIGADLFANPVFLVHVAAAYTCGPLRVGIAVDNLLDTRWHESELFFASRWDRTSPASALPRVQSVAGGPRVIRTFLEVHL
jgi:hypothetical protein